MTGPPDVPKTIWSLARRSFATARAQQPLPESPRRHVANLTGLHNPPEMPPPADATDSTAKVLVDTLLATLIPRQVRGLDKAAAALDSACVRRRGNADRRRRICTCDEHAKPQTAWVLGIAMGIRPSGMRRWHGIRVPPGDGEKQHDLESMLQRRWSGHRDSPEEASTTSTNGWRKWRGC